MNASLADFRIVHPTTVKDAIAARRQQPPSRFIAGGTDLIVNIRRGIIRPELLIDLSGIDELSEIRADGDGVTIGAGVTIATLASDPIIVSRYRAVAQAAEGIAGPGHRVMGTVGGNLCLDTRCIYYNQSEWWRSSNSYCLKNRGDTCHVAPQGNRCHATFSGDLAPALLVFGAVIDIAGPQSQRRIPLSQLYVEDGRAHLARAEDELVVSVRVPANPPASLYEKVRARGAIDFPLAGVAVALAKSADTIGSLRIASTGWCRSRCSRCAPRSFLPITGVSPLPRWRGDWFRSSPALDQAGMTAVASSSILAGWSSRSATKIMLIAT